MMLLLNETATGVHVRPHPKAPEYRRLRSYEKTRDAIWPESWVYRQGESEPLDLFERVEWQRYYPQNLRMAR
jgi:hypothetical protein